MRKNDLVIKVFGNGKRVKVYCNGKWQKGITDLNFSASVNQGKGIKIDCDCIRQKRDENDVPVLNSEQTDVETYKEKLYTNITD